MNAAGLMCARSFRRPPPLLPPPSIFSLTVQRRLQSTQPVPAARLPYRVKLSAGKRYAWCACGHSKKQPFCDGAHKAKAPNISPLLFTADKNKTVMLCACKQTNNSPYCDGSHLKVIYRDVVKYIKGLFK
ncbi:CDGSH iron-sulfur domain-containing protein 3, mitochondrial-like [Poeciliopsis prolifica]|uniref:CDGSH iron-sulfur domain-containing protein 3, mitochondrial-like n=1 Tax=Poeciliopsis prolifica TaxID=188132 RepID=UPI0024135C52|nr:CDGSH iron-sulfur domain-containing protein 3, mitochondrial-like [Poeciliopsis prolifica]